MSLPEYPQNLIPRPFANNGNRQLIPDDKMATGRASFKEGFPVETQLPLNSGGIAPNRTDFNGIFHMLSSLAFWQQSGGQMVYSAGLDYNVPSAVFHEGRLWWCLMPNGPSTVTPGVVPPGTDDDVWLDFAGFLRSGGHGAVQAITPEAWEELGSEKLTNGVMYILWREVGGGNFLIIQEIIMNGQRYKPDSGSTSTFPVGGIIMWSGAVNNIPANWALCDGTNGTPDLRDKFVVGAGNTYAVGTTGGASTHTHANAGTATLSGNVGATTLSTTQMPNHDHGQRYRTSGTSVDGSGSASSGGVNPTIWQQNLTTGTTGGGQSHTHSISGSASLAGNTGSASSLPPYYALAYIMYLGESQ